MAIAAAVPAGGPPAPAASDSIFLAAAAHLQALTLPVQIGAACSALLLAFVGYHLFLHPLRRVPAPLSVRLGWGGWRAWHAYKRDYVWALSDLHARYGPHVRIAPSHISTVSPAAVGQIYAHGSKFAKSSFYTAFEAIPGQPSLFSDIDPHSHAERRRSVAHAYSMHSLLALEECVRPCVDKLVARFDAAIARNAPVSGEKAAPAESARIQLDKWAHFFAFDAVGELAFGRSFQFLEHGSDSKRFMLGVANLSHFGAVSGCLPGLTWLRARGIDMYTLYCRAQAAWRKEPFGGLVVKEEAAKRVQERFDAVQFGKARDADAEEEEERSDLLAKFMAAKHSPKDKHRPNEKFDFLDVLRMCLSIIGAASDTTSGFISSFFILLLRHPEVYARLQAEIDDAFESGALDAERVTYAQSVRLEYLQACIKETLRIAPPISMNLPRLVPATGMQLELVDARSGAAAAPVFLPPGTTIGTAPYVFHRSTEAWGPDAAVFRPERWLNLEDRERGRLERHFLSFGAGSRICIGKSISLMETSILLPTLLGKFQFSFTDKQAPTVRDVFAAGDLGRRSDVWSGEYESTWFLDAQDVWVTVAKKSA